MAKSAKVSLGVTVVVVLVTNVLNTCATLYVNRSERPSTLIGYIENPPGAVEVVLNNGSAAQTVDDVSGWFGFEDLRRGQHHLRFEMDGFHPLPVTVAVVQPDDNYLKRKISLTPVGEATAPSDPLTIGVTVVPSFSRNGSLPEIDAEAIEPLINALRESASASTGWVYVGSPEHQTAEFRDLRFGVSNLEGQSVHAGSPVLLWNDAPRRKIRGYELGEVSGVADRGARITFLREVAEVGNGQVWAEVLISDDEENP